MAMIYYIRRKLAPNQLQAPMTKKTHKSNTPERVPDTLNAETASEKDKAETRSALQQAIESLLTDLLYPSESDEPIHFVTCYLSRETALTGSQIEEWLMVPPSVFVEELPENEFWEPVTIQEEWHGDEEKKRTEAFRSLKNVIEQHLSVRQFFRVGDSEIDIYLLGRTAQGDRAGLKTKVVET